jgi:CelD/BcsL family acetyltransferase involved in cellulose biosynthesis
MIIDRISNREQLAKLRCEWNALAGNVPFRRWDWQDAWWHHYGRSRELCVLAVRDSGGATIGIAPWFADTTIFDGHVLQFLGTGQACSDYLSLLCRPRHMKEVTTGLAKWLCGRHTQAGDGDRASLNWDYLRLAGTELNDPAMTLLAEQLRSADVSIDRHEHTRCWRIPLPNDWDAYLASRPKRYRRKIRRLVETYFDSGRAAFHLLPTDGPLAPSYDKLVSLHHARRHSLQQSGCFDSSSFRGFLRLASERFHADQQLFLATLQIDGQVAAATIGFAGSSVLYLYQCGMSPELSRHQPGWLINIGAIRHGIDSGLKSLDLLCGDEPYKKHLGASATPLYETCMVSPRIISRLRHGVWSAGLSVKRQLKDWAKSALLAK